MSRAANISEAFPAQPADSVDQKQVVATRNAILGLNTQVSDVWNVMPIAGSDDNSFPVRAYIEEPLPEDEQRDARTAPDATTGLTVSYIDIVVGLARALRTAIREHMDEVTDEDHDHEEQYIEDLLNWVDRYDA